MGPQLSLVVASSATGQELVRAPHGSKCLEIGGCGWPPLKPTSLSVVPLPYYDLLCTQARARACQTPATAAVAAVARAQKGWTSVCRCLVCRRHRTCGWGRALQGTGSSALQARRRSCRRRQDEGWLGAWRWGRVGRREVQGLGLGRGPAGAPNGLRHGGLAGPSEAWWRQTGRWLRSGFSASGPVGLCVNVKMWRMSEIGVRIGGVGAAPCAGVGCDRQLPRTALSADRTSKKRQCG